MKLLVFLVCALCTLNVGYGKVTIQKGNRAIDDFSNSLREFAASMLYRVDNPIEKLDALEEKPKQDNIFFSPSSIAHTLGMIMAGSGGQTLKEIQRALMITRERNYSPYNINNLFNKIYNKVFNSSKVKDLNLLLANALFMQEDKPANTGYIEALKEFYNAKLQWVNFNQADLAATIINGWVNHTTKGFIEEILKANDLSANTRLVLANAIYFKSKWKTTMKDLGHALFNGTNGEEHVPFIGSEGYEVRYQYVNGATKVAIPYKKPGVYLAILIPDDKDAMELFSRRNDMINFMRELPTIEKRWIKTKLNFSMPKFEIEQELDLKEILDAMGVRKLFSPIHANLSGISDDEDLYVASFTHKAKIRVNEKGTTAAAASAAAVVARTSNAQEIIIDKPFIFAIYGELQTLFVGKVNTIEGKGDIK